MKLLFLEDDTLFSETIVDFLEENDIEVVHVHDGEEALEYTYHTRFELYLFDINVPKLNGTTLLKLLRDAGDSTPTLFLTSHTDKETLMQGYDVGADDYIKKPVDIDELLLKIRAIEKRVYSGGQRQVCLQENIYFDTQTKQVKEEGMRLKLPQKALTLLALLIQHKGNMVSKEEIIQHLWHDELYSEGSLRVYISHIKKLLPKGGLKNIKGIGYSLEI